MSTNIRVVARIRPKLPSQQEGGECLSFKNSKIILHNQILSQYNFNDVIGTGQSQQIAYKKTGLIEVERMFQGHNSTIFIMGPQNSGKSYTLIGKQDFDNKGIIPKAFQHITQRIKTQPSNQFLLQISCIGCRKDVLYDLLSPHKYQLTVRENLRNQTLIENLSRKTIKTIEQLQAYLDYALRKQGITSKRQKDFHFVFTVFLQSKSKQGYKKGSVNFIKLSDIFSQLNQEKTRINIASLSIYNIINSLSDYNIKYQIPYGDSKFTWLFRNCFGGNMNTTILLTLNQYDGIIKIRQYLQLGRKAMKIENVSSIQQPDKIFQLQKLLQKLEQMEKLQFNEYQQKSRERFQRHKQTIYRNQFISPNQFSHKNEKNQFNSQKKQQDSQISLKIQDMKKLILNYFPQTQNDKQYDYRNKRANRQNQYKEQLNKRAQLSNNAYLISSEKRVVQSQIFQNEQLFQRQRQCYLSSIRQLQKQLSLYKQLAESVLGKQNIKLIKQNSELCNLTRTFKIPQFSFKNGFLRINPLKSNEQRQKIRKQFSSHPLLSKDRSTQKIRNIANYQIWANQNDDIKPEQKSFFSPYLTHKTPKSGDKNSWKSGKGRKTNTQGNEYMLVATPQNNKQRIQQKMSRSWSKKFR